MSCAQMMSNQSQACVQLILNATSIALEEATDQCAGEMNQLEKHFCVTDKHLVAALDASEPAQGKGVAWLEEQGEWLQWNQHLECLTRIICAASTASGLVLAAGQRYKSVASCLRPTRMLLQVACWHRSRWAAAHPPTQSCSTSPVPG